MQYEVKKKQILHAVEFTNLLSFNLMQNKLERNFRSIVDALLLNQAKTQQLNQDHLSVKEKHQKEIQQLNDKFKQIKKQLQEQKNQNQKLKIQTSSQIKDINEQKLPSNNKLSAKQLSNKQLSLSTSKIDQIKLNELKQWQNNWDKQKNNYLHQINELKNKLGMLGYFQNQLQTLKNQMNQMKSEINHKLEGNGSKSNLKSNKSLIKRQSLMNLVSGKISERNIEQPATLVNNQSKKSLRTIVQQNKQNQPQQQITQTPQQINISQLLEKQLNSIYLELNTFKISFQQIKDILSDTKKQSYKNNLTCNQLKQDLIKQIKTRTNENQELNKKLKQLQLQMLNIGMNNVPASEKNNYGEKDTNNKKSNSDDQMNINNKNQLNDKISKLQQMIAQMPNQAQFNRLKNDLNDKFEKLNNKIQIIQKNSEQLENSLLDKISQNTHSIQEQIKDIKDKLSQNQENNKMQASQNQRKHNILNAKNQQLKKSIQNLRQDLEFYQNLMNQNNNKDNKRSLHFEDQESKKQNSSNNGVSQKAVEELKKHFNHKLHDMRTNLLNIIRDLQRKLATNKPNAEQQIIKIWDKINEINLFMNKKADQDDTKKTFLYIEKKMNRLNSAVFKNDDNTQDARIARTNQWHCLSCDKNLQSYQGKLGKHIVWDSMPLKGINKAVLISSTNQIDDKKKALPQLNKRS